MAVAPIQLASNNKMDQSRLNQPTAPPGVVAIHVPRSEYWFKPGTPGVEENDDDILFEFGFFNLTVVKHGNEEMKTEVQKMQKSIFQFIEPDDAILELSESEKNHRAGRHEDGHKEGSERKIFNIVKADISDLGTNDFFSMHKVPTYVLVYAGAVVASQVIVLGLILQFKSNSCYHSRAVDMFLVRLFVAFYLSVQIVGSMSNIFTHSLTEVLDHLNPTEFWNHAHSDHSERASLVGGTSSSRTIRALSVEANGARYGTPTTPPSVDPTPNAESLVGKTRKLISSCLCGCKTESLAFAKYMWANKKTWVFTFWAPIVAPFATNLKCKIRACIFCESALILTLAMATAVITKQQDDVMSSVVNFAGVLLVFELDNLAMRAINFRPKVLTFESHRVKLNDKETTRVAELRDLATFMLSFHYFIFIMVYLFFSLHAFMNFTFAVVVFYFLCAGYWLDNQKHEACVIILLTLAVGFLWFLSAITPGLSCIISIFSIFE